MISDELELRNTYAALTKLVRLRASIESETIYVSETQKNVIEGIDIQIRKLEAEVAEYLAQREAAPAPDREPAAASRA